MAWHHHESREPRDSNSPEPVISKTTFTHLDQIDHLSDIMATIDVHNLAEWDEKQQVDKQFYLDAEDKKNTIPPLMKRFIRTFKDRQ